MSSPQIRPFRALYQNQSVNLTVTAAAANIALPVIPLGYPQLRVVNVGTQVVYVEFNENSAANSASLTTSTAILPNTAQIFTVGNDKTYISAIAASTGSVLNITVGEGIS